MLQKNRLYETGKQMRTHEDGCLSTVKISVNKRVQKKQAFLLHSLCLSSLMQLLTGFYDVFSFLEG